MPDQPAEALQGDYQGPAEVPNGNLPEDVATLLRSLAKKVSLRDMWPRLNEIKHAAEQRYFYQGYQHIYWSRSNNAFQIGPSGASTVAWGQDAAHKARIRRTYNIYLGYAKSFMAVFSQSSPGTRFQPDDPKDPVDIKAAPECDRMRRVIEKFNDPKVLQVETARLLWTDGRVVAFTDFVRDEERFGVDENGQPNGRETIWLGGVLETQIPLVAHEQHDMDYIKISREKPLSRQKAKYPDKEKQLSHGAKGYSDVEEVARNARIGIAEDLRWLAEAELAYICTEDMYFFRPSTYYEFQQKDREKLEEYFPDGCRVVFTGQTLCESRNDKLDDHISILKALPADSQRGISLGRPMVEVQMEFNDWMNMTSEAGKYAIPATFVDQNVIDIDAVQEQYSEYGAYYPAERSNQAPLAECFYREQAVEISPVFVTFMENLQGPLAQFVSGQMPSVFGGNMEDQKTAKAYSLAREAALGLLSLNWYTFKKWYCRVMEQAVRAAAENREEGSVLSTVVGQAKDQELVEINVASMKGNVICTPITDENFPESPTQKRNVVMQLLQLGAADPIIGQHLDNPDNLELLYEVYGLEDVVINGRDSRNKQLQEIAELLQSPPAPDIQAIGAEVQQSVATTGQPPPLDPKTMPMKSTVPIGKYDDDAIEFQECVRWINSPEGQTAKVENPDGYANVECHADEHKARMDANAAAQMAMQAQMTPPKGSEPRHAGEPSPPKQQPVM